MNSNKLYRLVAHPKMHTVSTKKPDRNSEKLRSLTTRVPQCLAHPEGHTHTAIRSQPPGNHTQSMQASTALPIPEHSEKYSTADETQIHQPHRNASCELASQASPRRPPHLFPVAGLSACYLKCLSSRSFSTDQSVTSRTVSDSTTSYPSMGFVPLQGTTACSL